MALLSWLIFAESSETQDRLRDALEVSARSEVQTVTREVTAIGRLVDQHHPDALLVELGEKADLTLDAVEALPSPRPLMIAIGPEGDSRLILRAMRCGATEYLPDTVGAEGLAASITSLGRQEIRVATSHHAAVVGVLAAKGGLGGSFVTCQLASTLAGSDTSVNVVDLALRQGDVALYLDVESSYTLADVARRDGPIDSAYLKTILQARSPKLSVLAAPAEIEEAELVTSSRVDTTFDVLMGESDWLLVDLSRDFDDITLRTLDRLDLLLLVTTVDIPALHHTRRNLELLDRIGFPMHKVRLLANRDTDHNAVTDKDLSEFVGRPADAKIPNDFGASHECVSFGKSLADVAPRSEITEAFAELAANLYEWVGRDRPEIDDAPKGLRGYLKRAFHGAN